MTVDLNVLKSYKYRIRLNLSTAAICPRYLQKVVDLIGSVWYSEISFLRDRIIATAIEMERIHTPFIWTAFSSHLPSPPLCCYDWLAFLLPLVLSNILFKMLMVPLLSFWAESTVLNSKDEEVQLAEMLNQLSRGLLDLEMMATLVED